MYTDMRLRQIRTERQHVKLWLALLSFPHSHQSPHTHTHEEVYIHSSHSSRSHKRLTSERELIKPKGISSMLSGHQSICPLSLHWVKQFYWRTLFICLKPSADHSNRSEQAAESRTILKLTKQYQMYKRIVTKKYFMHKSIYVKHKQLSDLIIITSVLSLSCHLYIVNNATSLHDETIKRTLKRIENSLFPRCRDYVIGGITYNKTTYNIYILPSQYYYKNIVLP